ncbi:MAG: glucosaminidase domain-containing protein [Chitinophagales bacterium]
MINVYRIERLLFFKLSFLLLVSCLCCNACIEADEMKARLYIEDFKMLAIEEMQRMGVPASIKLAQAMLESDYGNSRLAYEGKNHFGIKCKAEWLGDRIYHTDDAPDECFRKYHSVYESYLDHSEFLRFHKFNYYDDLFLLDKTDYRGWAYGLKKAGYATNPRYAELLIALIERYRLYEYDNAIVSRLDGNGSPVILYGAAANTIIFSNYQQNALKQKPSLASAKTLIDKSFVEFKDNNPPKDMPAELAVLEAMAGTETNSNSSDKEENQLDENVDIVAKEERIVPHYQQMVVNGKRAVTSNVPLMPAFVSHTYNVPLSKLYDYNDLLVGQKFKPDTPIFFQKKKSKSDTKAEHIVMEGETMHDISQHYGVKLLKLYRRNKLPLNANPIEGEIVQLQKKVKESPKYRL